MKYITKRGTNTGLKFNEILKARDAARKALHEVMAKYNTKNIREARGAVYGGISSCLFEENPDTKIWGKGDRDGEFMPKRNTKKGKAISEEFLSLPTVSIGRLNMCIGFEGAPFKTIGFAFNDDYFGFSVGEDWGCKIPDDCEEILTSKYNELFK